MDKPVAPVRFHLLKNMFHAVVVYRPKKIVAGSPGHDRAQHARGQVVDHIVAREWQCGQGRFVGDVDSDERYPEVDLELALSNVGDKDLLPEVQEIGGKVSPNKAAATYNDVLHAIGLSTVQWKSTR
jgi:hypothetical protein